MALSDLLGLSKSSVSPNSRVAAALARAGVSKTPELIRVLNLPRRSLDMTNIPDASPVYVKGTCGRSICQYCQPMPRLRAIQSAMLLEAASANGGFFNVGVGQGKTLASLLFHDAMQARRTALLVPASLRTQLLKVDEPALRKHFNLPPVYGVDAIGNSWKPDGTYVIAYTELSDTDASGLLDQLAPDLIVADEAHNLRHKDAARTRRFLRYMRANPTRFVCMSGTLSNRSIMDYWHLIELALGKNTPLPLHYPDVVTWADAIDHEGEEGHTGPGALSMLCEDGENLRIGYQRRLRDTPGVISTTESACTSALEIRIHRPMPAPLVSDAMSKLRATWAWGDEEYDDQLDISRVMRQLAQGFCYRLIWPNNQRDQEWLDKRNAWHKAVRDRLSHTNKAGLDSPALLKAAAERGDWTPPEWFDWIAIKDRVEPGHEAVEIDRWLADYAYTWTRGLGKPSIVWVDSPIVGHWLNGLGVPYFGEGMDLELSQATPQKTPVIAASIRAHGTGKNLQAWSHNLILWPMASGSAWEQLMGRTHRPGQAGQVVTVDVVLPCKEAEGSFQQAKKDARFIEDTSGTPQKLNFATYVELPGS